MQEEKGVKIVGVAIPFADMVAFMVKWVVASIPAAIILIVCAAIFSAFFAGIMKAG